MKRDDIEKLLGAYATGTLTVEERDALYQAALSDQTLFDALMAEEPLRELFDDPVVRARLVAVLSDSPAPKRSWWLRPAPWALGGALAMAGLVAFFVVTPREPVSAPMAKLQTELAPPPAALPPPVAPVEKKKVEKLARALPRESPMADAAKPVGIAGFPPAPAESKVIVQELERAENVPAAVVASAGSARPIAKSEVAPGLAQTAFVEPPHAPSKLALPTLDYKVLRQSGDKFVETAAGTVFEAGDTVRIAIVPPADGHISIGSAPDVAFQLIPARKGVRLVVPSEGGIKLGPGSGSRTVRLVFVAAAKGHAGQLEARQMRAKEISKSVEAPAPITVDVVLKFR